MAKPQSSYYVQYVKISSNQPGEQHAAFMADDDNAAKKLARDILAGEDVSVGTLFRWDEERSRHAVEIGQVEIE